MTSKEMEARSGVPRANIRYYEAEGLLTPARAKNGYREYSEEDLAALEKIKLLRRLGVSIEELKGLRAGNVKMFAVLDRRLAELGGERETLGRVEQVCGALKAAGETFAALEPGKYLEALDAPALPSGGREAWWGSGQPAPLPAADQLPVADSPWRRLAARSLDELFMTALLVVVICLTGHNPSRGGVWITVLAQVCLLFLEPLAIHLTGTTLGKAALGMRLRGSGGDRLTYGEAFCRHILMLWSGLGLWIPIWSLVQMYRSFRRCADGEPQPWDSGIAYEMTDFRPLRHVGAWVLAAAMLLAAAEAANSFSQLPPNRGPLTVAEFAENFNRQAQYLDVSFRNQVLDEQGAWTDLPDSGTIYWDSTGQEENLPFRYTVENGRLTALRLTLEAGDTESWVEFPIEQMLTAVTAFTWAQKQAPFWSFGRKTFVEDLAKADWEKGFTLHQAGTTITLETESQGFYISTDLGMAFPIDEGDHFLAVTFTIELDE